MGHSARTFAGLALSSIVAFGTLSVRGDGAEAQQQQQQQQQQKPPATDQQPVFKGGINYVRVDVIVSDKQGNPVDNLQEGDFDVSEDGKPQKIDTFKLVKLDGGIVEASHHTPRAIRSDFDE